MSAEREIGYYWIHGNDGWTPHAHWDGKCWSFPWSTSDFTDEEVGEIGPLLQPPTFKPG